MPELIVLGIVALFVLVTLAKSVRIVPQARAGVVERLGRYSRTLTPGLALVVRRWWVALLLLAAATFAVLVWLFLQALSGLE